VVSPVLTGLAPLFFLFVFSKTNIASATASGGFLGLPGFEALYAVAGLLVVAYLVMRRRK
jgi:PGF-CTERM protein